MTARNQEEGEELIAFIASFEECDLRFLIEMAKLPTYLFREGIFACQGIRAPGDHRLVWPCPLLPHKAKSHCIRAEAAPAAGGGEPEPW